jgi:hypothetical protein
VVDHPYSFGSGCRDLVLHAKARRARLIRVRVSPCGSLLGHQILARAALGVGNLPGRDCPILRSWRGSLRGVSPLRAHGLAHVQLSHFGAKVGQLKSQACHAQGIEGPGGKIIRSASRSSNVLWWAARRQAAARADPSAG